MSASPIRVWPNTAEVHQRAEQVERELAVDVGAQVSSRQREIERPPYGGARRIEEHGHEGRAQPFVVGAVGQQRAEHIRREALEGVDEEVDAVDEVTERAARVGCAELVHPVRERREHEVLPSRPAPVDGRLRGARAARDLFERETAVARALEHIQRRAEHGTVDARIARAADRCGSWSVAGGHTAHRIGMLRYGS
jgi:hypothetical protein